VDRRHPDAAGGRFRRAEEAAQEALRLLSISGTPAAFRISAPDHPNRTIKRSTVSGGTADKAQIAEAPPLVEEALRGTGAFAVAAIAAPIVRATRAEETDWLPDCAAL